MCWVRFWQWNWIDKISVLLFWKRQSQVTCIGLMISNGAFKGPGTFKVACNIILQLNMISMYSRSNVGYFLKEYHIIYYDNKLWLMEVIRLRACKLCYPFRTNWLLLIRCAYLILFWINEAPPRICSRRGFQIRSFLMKKNKTEITCHFEPYLMWCLTILLSLFKKLKKFNNKGAWMFDSIYYRTCFLHENINILPFRSSYGQHFIKLPIYEFSYIH